MTDISEAEQVHPNSFCRVVQNGELAPPNPPLSMQHTPLPLDTHKTTRALHRLSNSLPIFYLFDRRFLCPFCVNNLGNTLLTVLKSTYLSAPKVSFAIFLAVFFLKLGLASSTTLLCSSQPSLFDKISSGTYRGGYNGGVPSQPATNVG